VGVLRQWRERLLVKRIRSGDRQAAEQLVDEHYQNVYRWLLHLCRHREHAADLTQETFVQVWDGLDGFCGQASLQTWIHRIAYHTYLCTQRNPTPEPQLLCAVLDVAGPDIPEVTLTRHLVHEALARLPEKQRHTVVLHYLHGLTAAEVAEVLQIPTGTVLSRLHTSRATLRELLSDESSSSEQEVQADWPKSDERRVRKLFRTVQPEPVPETLRVRLQPDIETHFPEPSPGAASNGWGRRKPLLLAGATALTVVCLLLGITLLPTNTGKGGAPLLPAAVAETIEGATAAMAKVEQAHLVGQTWWDPTGGSPVSERKPIPREAWYSAEHGVRYDDFYGPRETVRTTYSSDKETGKPIVTEETIMQDGFTDTSVTTPEMAFSYNDNSRQIILRPSSAREYEAAVEGVLRSGWSKYIVEAQPRQPGSALKDVTVTDDTLAGVPTKRIDYEASYEAYRMPDGRDRPAYIIKGKVWFEADTLRVLRYETLTIEGDDEILSWGQIDYDTPVDASLFAVPEGLKVRDTRLAPASRGDEEQQMPEHAIIEYDAAGGRHVVEVEPEDH